MEPYFISSTNSKLHLQIISEDNNTRVLFERVLSSGGLTSELSIDVWNRFLEFESNIGDLSSIVKVERRRSTVLQNVSVAQFFFGIFFYILQRHSLINK